MSKHTPGPWVHDRDGEILGPDNVIVVYAHGAQRAVQTDEDARLIAAAPDLLEALENLIDACSRPDGRICCDGHDCGCMGTTYHQLAEHYAKEAIAKARGEK